MSVVRFALASLLAVLVLMPGAFADVPASPPATAACAPKVIRPLRTLRATLAEVHRDTGQRGTITGRIYYGRCGRPYFALASFRSAAGLTDQPTAFRRFPGGRWREIGDGACDPTQRVVPRVLIRAWKVCSG